VRGVPRLAEISPLLTSYTAETEASEASKPPKITSAIGAWISLTGFSMPNATGIRVGRAPNNGRGCGDDFEPGRLVTGAGLLTAREFAVHSIRKKLPGQEFSLGNLLASAAQRAVFVQTWDPKQLNATMSDLMGAGSGDQTIRDFLKDKIGPLTFAGQYGNSIFMTAGAVEGLENQTVNILHELLHMVAGGTAENVMQRTESHPSATAKG
jgi:hypothetical protein